jgi:cytochrome c oxidase assembly protein subunit 15
VTHRLGAVLAGGWLMMIGCLTLLRAERRRLRVAGALLVLAVALQIGIGLTMVHFALPLPLATMHNAGAALLVIAMVTLLRSLRPADERRVVP